MQDTMNNNESLCNLPNHEVDDRASELGRIVAAAGYDETPRGLANKWNCWGITVGEFVAMLKKDFAAYTLPVSTDPSYYGSQCSAEDAVRIARAIGYIAKAEFPGLTVEVFSGIGSGAVRGPDSAVCESIRGWVENNWTAAL